ncbi:MAG: hypothetical protein WC693_04160 [Patescibacteria group bacterium]|jgi:hypothetical protein
MEPNKYLEEKIKTCVQTEIRTVDREFLNSQGMEEYIYRMLTSKNFRKWKIVDNYIEEIKKSIKYAVSKNEPLELTWFFGGYKLWRISSSPYVDWAELFSIIYLVNYASSVATVYDPGVKIIFWAAHPSVMKYQSNIPEEDCLNYRESFNMLLNIIRPSLPNNITVELKSFEILYPNPKEYLEELNRMILEVEREYKKGWTVERKDRKNASSVLNIQWQGAENWRDLSAAEKEEKIRRGPIIHDGYCRLSKIGQVIRGLGKIDLTATPIPNGSIAVGCTSSSVTKFWTGFGVLEKRGDGYVERILSPKQLDSIKGRPHDIIKSKIIPLKNFEEILVFHDTIDFSKNK